MNKKSKLITFIVLAVMAIVVAVIIFINYTNGGAAKIDFSEFTDYVANYSRYYDEEGNVDQALVAADGYHYSENTKRITNGKGVVVAINRVVFDGYSFHGYFNGVRCVVSIGPSMYGSDALTPDNLLMSWMENGISVGYEDPNAGSWVSELFSLGGLILVCVVFWLIMRSSMGGGQSAASFAKTKARVTTNVKVRFTDVAGAEEEKVELAEIVEFLRSPKKFLDLGAKTPKGVILVGPPGTGKTLFAKAVAGEAGVPFFSVSGSDFVEMYVGVGASRVRDLFDMAKRNAPCIVFIDEIDAVGRHRGSGIGGGNDEREQTLNQILVQMDGFEQSEGVIVMAATNRADILDPALMRPGRFDRQVYVNLPDVKGREEILKVHARNKPMARDVNFKTVARMTSGFSGADLANLLNEAAILAARANKKFIGNNELYEGINKVLMGPKKTSHIVTESDKRIVAYHESGHAVLGMLCKNCNPVQEVTIIPRGNAGGYTLTRPDNDNRFVSKSQMLDDICMTLGGRIAEALVIKDVTQGASNDLQVATNRANVMVTKLGMSEKLGLATYGGDSQTLFLGKDMEYHNTYSEETARLIDSETRTILQEQYDRGVKLLTDNRSILDNMARVLIEKETIRSEEVEMLMAGKDYKEVIAHIESQEAENANPFQKLEDDEPKQSPETTADSQGEQTDEDEE